MKKLGRYQLSETLGAGSMSTVYKGVDTASGETVAIKVLHGHLATTANIARFAREAHVLAALIHPNIVALKSFSDGKDGQHYSVLEYVEGNNLAEFLSRVREIEADLAAMLLLELTKAVSLAHAKGIVHRDLKPENILIDPTGRPKISDFGLAYLWEGTDLTVPGTVIGSPAFMSPEQIRGEKPSPSMDIFSLGILFYLFLAGELPFHGKNRRATFDQIMNHPPVPPEEVAPHLPRELSTLCSKMLAKKSEQRFATCDEVIRELERYLAGVGLSQYEQILQKFMVAPRENYDEVRKLVLNGYLRVGKQAIDRKQKERVFEIFQRVLVLTGMSSVACSPSEESLPTRRVRFPRPGGFGFWLYLLVIAAIAGTTIWLTEFL